MRVHTHKHTHTHTFCVCMCVRLNACVHAHLPHTDGMKFKAKLYKHNQRVSYQFGLYYACAGVTFEHVELTMVNVDIAI